MIIKILSPESQKRSFGRLDEMGAMGYFISCKRSAVLFDWCGIMEIRSFREVVSLYIPHAVFGQERFKMQLTVSF